MSPPQSSSWLTSSSQYFRITSKALSVISGASKTTLVKILPKKDQVLQGSHMLWPQADNTFPNLRTQLQTGAGWCLSPCASQLLTGR